MSFFYGGKNRDEIIFLFPLCEGGLLKYLGIDLLKYFTLNLKHPFYWVIPFITFSMMHFMLSAQVPAVLDSKMKPGISNDMRIEELKVRWKKAALENCPGVPCVTTPPAPSFTCGTSTVTDIDGNQYNTKLIGTTQCWTTTNLKVTRYNDGTLINDLTSSSNWGTAVIGARTGYVATGVSSSDYVGTFGYLYNWYAVNDSRKLCPDGWHVPIDAEWTNLIRIYDPGASASATDPQPQSITAGAVLKSTVTNTNAGVGLGWDPIPSFVTTPSPATNTSGFSGLPGGYRSNIGSFQFIRSDAYFWSANENVNKVTDA